METTLEYRAPRRLSGGKKLGLARREYLNAHSRTRHAARTAGVQRCHLAEWISLPAAQRPRCPAPGGGLLAWPRPPRPANAAHAALFALAGVSRGLWLDTLAVRASLAESMPGGVFVRALYRTGRAA